MVKTQTCFKCHIEKPLSEFYKHSQMGNGHVGKCKECNKQDVRENYDKRRQQYSAYDQKRNTLAERRQKKREYGRRHRERYPEKAKARYAVANAIRDGKLRRQACERCGKKAQAHHEDYSKPLDVKWLCFQHHREHHGQQVTVKEC